MSVSGELSERDIARIESALTRRGFRLTRLSNERPWRYEGFDLETDREVRLALHVWPLLLHRRQSGRFGQYRGQPTYSAGLDSELVVSTAPARADVTETTLVLGYHRLHDILVDWPITTERRIVLASVVEEAVEFGRAVQRRGDAPPVVAFRRQHLAERVREHLKGRRRHELRETLLLGTIERIDRAKENAPFARPNVVATGFATGGDGAEYLLPIRPLAPSVDYSFWFGVGVDRRFAIDREPVSLPRLPPGSRLTVELFSFPGELELVGAKRGMIEIDAGGRSRVVEPAAQPGIDADRLLHFPIRTPDRRGPARLRCNVYLGATLVQSHLVTAAVGERQQGSPWALRTELDYRISDVLSGENLARAPRHQLSLMVNGTGVSHQFRVVGEDGGELLSTEASLDSVGLQDSIGAARGALMRAAWGTETEWDGHEGSYRYAAPATVERVTGDLVDLAVRGARLYGPLAAALAGGDDGRDVLERVAERRREVQIASADGGLYVPAALFYDHRIDDYPPADARFRLCAASAAAIRDRAAVEHLPCFEGGCAEHDDRYAICISGFWGFRHDLGWPLSTDEPIVELHGDGEPRLCVAISTDPGLTLRDGHVERLARLAACQIVDDRDELEQVLRQSAGGEQPAPDVFYFYCHGGVAHPNTPYLEIGPRDSGGITQVYLRQARARFADAHRRPIAFVNGCRTTALEPRLVMNLADGFVRETRMPGVVGTEVTVFEGVATRFAEVLLEAFLDGSATIGAAVRLARLRLLQERNPLGLAYVPFIAAPTRLVRAPA